MMTAESASAQDTARGHVYGAINNLRPITADIREKLQYGGKEALRAMMHEGLPTTATGVAALEELIRGTTHAGPLGELSLGGAVGVLTHRFLKTQPHLEQNIRNQLFTGVEFQAACAVMSSEVFHMARTGKFAPETLVVLSFFLDEFLARAVHTKTGLIGKLPIDAKHITRVTAAFMEFGISMFAAHSLNTSGRPEVAWALGIAGVLNFGEAALTSADKDVLLARAFENQTRKMEKESRIDVSCLYQKKQQNIQKGIFISHGLTRKIQIAELRALHWHDIATHLHAEVAQTPDMQSQKTESLLLHIFENTMRDITPGPGPHMRYKQIPERAVSKEARLRIRMEKDLKAIRDHARQEANFWSFPQQVDERAKAFFQKLFHKDAQGAADVLSNNVPQQDTVVVAAEPASAQLSAEEIDLATFWRNVINDERIPDEDRKDFIHAMSDDNTHEIRQWIGWLEQEYGELFPFAN